MALIVDLAPAGFGAPLTGCYVRITDYFGDKDAFKFTVKIYPGRGARLADLRPLEVRGLEMPRPTTDCLVAAYEYLKTLPEFAGAQDDFSAAPAALAAPTEAAEESSAGLETTEQVAKEMEAATQTIVVTLIEMKELLAIRVTAIAARRAGMTVADYERVAWLANKDGRSQDEDNELLQHENWAVAARDVETARGVKLREIGALATIPAAMAYDVDAGWPQ